MTSLPIKYIFTLPQPFTLFTCVIVCHMHCSAGADALKSFQFKLFASYSMLVPQPVWSLHDLTPLWHQNVKLSVWLLLTCKSLAWPHPSPFFTSPRREVNIRGRCSSICLDFHATGYTDSKNIEIC